MDSNPNPRKKLKSVKNGENIDKKLISTLISVKSDRIKYV